MKMNLMLAAGVLALMPNFGFAAEAGVDVDVTLKPASSFKAHTGKVSGVAYQNAGAVSAENVLIDLNSLSSGISLRDKHMKERLLVEKYPQAKLIKASGKDGKGTATLEIKGKKQEVAGTYTVKDGMLKAQFKVNLPALEIKDIRYMGVGVADDITINVNLPIKAGAPAASPRVPAAAKTR